MPAMGPGCGAAGGRGTPAPEAEDRPSGAAAEGPPGAILPTPTSIFREWVSRCWAPQPRAWSPQRVVLRVTCPLSLARRPSGGRGTLGKPGPASPAPAHSLSPTPACVLTGGPGHEAGPGGGRRTEGRTADGAGASPELRLPVGCGFLAACPGCSLPVSGSGKPVLRPMAVTGALWSPGWPRCSDLTSCLFPVGPAVLTSLPAAPPTPCVVVVFKSLPEDAFIDTGRSGRKRGKPMDGASLRCAGLCSSHWAAGLAWWCFCVPYPAALVSLDVSAQPALFPATTSSLAGAASAAALRSPQFLGWFWTRLVGGSAGSGAQ